MGFGDAERDDERALLNRWHRPVFDFVLRRLGNEADAADVTQDALLSILRDRAALRDPDKERAWVYKVARFAISHHRRGATRYRARLTGSARQGSAPDSADLAEARDVRAALKRCLGELAAELREPLELRYLHGLSQVEVSEALALPRGTVRGRIDAGLARLRRRLSAAGWAAAAPDLGREISALGLSRPPRSAALALRDAALGQAPSTKSLALTTGGALVKLKTLSALTAVAALGLLSGVALSRGETEAIGRSARQRSAQLAGLQRERARLEARLRRLTAGPAPARAPAAQSPERHDLGAQALRAEVAAAEARRAELRAALAAAEAIGAEGAEPLTLLAERWLALHSDGSVFLAIEALPPRKRLEIDRLQRRADAVEPAGRVEAAIRLLDDRRYRPIRGLLLRFLQVDPSAEGARGAQERANRAALRLLRDRSFSLTEIFRLFDILAFSEASTDLAASARALQAMADDMGSFYAVRAYEALSSMPYDPARERVLDLFLDPGDNLLLSAPSLVSGFDFSCSPRGREVLIELCGHTAACVRSAAYRSAAKLEPSADLRDLFEERARTERSGLGELESALVAQGDAATAVVLEAIAADPGASLKRRAFAESAARSLRERLAARR